MPPRQDPEKLTKNVGRRIAEIRKERGLTQAEVAALAEAPVKWWSRVEQGHENLTLHTMARLANALEVDVAAFLEAPKSEAKKRRGRPRKT